MTTVELSQYLQLIRGFTSANLIHKFIELCREDKSIDAFDLIIICSAANERITELTK